MADDRKRTFTRGLSRNDPVEILRAQMRVRGDLDPARHGSNHLGVCETAPVLRQSPGRCKFNRFYWYFFFHLSHIFV